MQPFLGTANRQHIAPSVTLSAMAAALSCSSRGSTTCACIPLFRPRSRHSWIPALLRVQRSLSCDFNIVEPGRERAAASGHDRLLRHMSGLRLQDPPPGSLAATDLEAHATEGKRLPAILNIRMDNFLKGKEVCGECMVDLWQLG
jgi:hypothetical protein